MKENIIEVAEDIVDEYAVNKLEAVMRVIDRLKNHRSKLTSNKVVLEKIVEDANDWLGYLAVDERFEDVTQMRFRVRNGRNGWFIEYVEKEDD